MEAQFSGCRRIFAPSLRNRARSRCGRFSRSELLDVTQGSQLVLAEFVAHVARFISTMDGLGNRQMAPASTEKWTRTVDRNSPPKPTLL